ncbi:uncharacterized protein LOC143693875 [Agelaius phoeniceus]|uniref:uncharacterized protein LOC143693875 n=1 Tax=Agelaius phoeniceus TaxID=39638 RepID=UPI00405522C3
MGTSEVAVEEVLPALLSVIEEQPPYGGFLCSGDNEAVLALAATLVLWRIASMPEWHYAILLHSPRLLVALLLQIVTTTEQRPEDVETQRFWRACREEHGLPSEPNREMRCGLSPLCPHMASHLLSLLIGKQPRWHLPVLAFFVEAGGIRGLYQHLVELLAHPDAEMVGMSLSVLTHVLQDKDLEIPSTAALKLAESLLPHFEKLFGRAGGRGEVWCDAAASLAGGSAASCPGASRAPASPGLGTGSRLPCDSPGLWCHLRLSAALQASREALRCAARFLRRRDLQEPLRKKRRMKFAESLLLQDESRAAEHLRWALPHLRSPQRPLREAAVRFLGVAGVLMMGQKEELKVLSQALQALREDESPSSMNTWIQMKFERRSAELRLSPGPDVPVPASFDDFQLGPPAAPGTALAALS